MWLGGVKTPLGEGVKTCLWGGVKTWSLMVSKHLGLRCQNRGGQVLNVIFDTHTRLQND